jgi:hypothetical protein
MIFVHVITLNTSDKHVKLRFLRVLQQMFVRKIIIRIVVACKLLKRARRETSGLVTE